LLVIRFITDITFDKQKASCIKKLAIIFLIYGQKIMILDLLLTNNIRVIGILPNFPYDKLKNS
ncbi:hypothetical protein BpHYR1_043716, partial [Brachionus plicatilis]